MVVGLVDSSDKGVEASREISDAAVTKTATLFLS